MNGAESKSCPVVIVGTWFGVSEHGRHSYEYRRPQQGVPEPPQSYLSLETLSVEGYVLQRELDS